MEVSQRFRNQYTRLIHESEDYAANEELQERIRSGAGYFHKELEPVRALYDKTNMPLDNKELRKLLAERMQALDDALWIKGVFVGSCVYKREVCYHGLFEVEG